MSPTERVEVFFGEGPAEGGDVLGTTGIPIAVDDQPVAQVLDFTDGDVFEQFGTRFEKTEVTGEFVFFATTCQICLG